MLRMCCMCALQFTRWCTLPAASMCTVVSFQQTPTAAACHTDTLASVQNCFNQPGLKHRHRMLVSTVADCPSEHLCMLHPYWQQPEAMSCHHPSAHGLLHSLLPLLQLCTLCHVLRHQ